MPMLTFSRHTNALSYTLSTDNRSTGETKNAFTYFRRYFKVMIFGIFSEGGELVKLEDTLEIFGVVTEVMRSSNPAASYAWSGKYHFI